MPIASPKRRISATFSRGAPTAIAPADALTPIRHAVLFINNVEVRLARHGVLLGTLALQHLALAQRRHRTAYMRHQVELAARKADIHVPRKDEVAQYHRLVRLPAGIGRRAAPPRIRLVDHVVVDERRHVDHLHEHRGQMHPPPFGRTLHRGVHRRRQHHQQRTYALPARGKRITQHVGKQFPFGRKLTVDEPVERLQFRSHRFADRIECNHKTNLTQRQRTQHRPGRARIIRTSRTPGRRISLAKIVTFSQSRLVK